MQHHDPTCGTEESVCFCKDRKDLYESVSIEASRAAKLFPLPDHLGMAFGEESGEVIKAINEYRFGKCSIEEVCVELVQCMAMCVRLFEEGDPTHGLPPIMKAIRAKAK